MPRGKRQPAALPKEERGFSFWSLGCDSLALKRWTPQALFLYMTLRGMSKSILPSRFRVEVDTSQETCPPLQSIADTHARRVYTFGMSCDPLEPKDSARAEYHARWEAVETAKAQELAAMTEERARQIIQMLGAVEGWRERLDWSGLVEQQAIFQKGRQA